jgi:hypothetical protein
MLLTTAIKKHAATMAAAQTTYQQNVATVNTFINSVLSSKLPTLSTPPPDFANFATTYEQANSKALGWVNNVMGKLLNVPDDVAGYNGVILALLQDAQGLAQALLADPSDQNALDGLNADLDTVVRKLNLVTVFITNAIGTVRNFGDVLPALATDLQTITSQSAQAAHADQAQIDEFNGHIAALNNDIKALQAAIIALGIADGVSITLGLVATIAAWPIGALTWLVLGPAVAIATTYIALDALKIKADVAQIEADQKQITGLTADVAALQVLTSNYTAMAEQTQQIQDSLQAVLAAWQWLVEEVATAIEESQQALSDAGSHQFQAVLDDLATAIQEWEAAFTQAGSLKLDLQVNPAPLQLGMSSHEVQTTLAAGQAISIIEYFNQVAVA